MALIAQQDTFVRDADGIRRKIVAGSPVPAHLVAGFQEEVATETVDTRSLAVPVVDEEASKSQAQRAAEGATTVAAPASQVDAGAEQAKAAKRAARKDS
jgi:hypothetical protein